MKKYNLKVVIMAALLTKSSAHAEVVFDGTLGFRGALQGPNYAIGAELGQQRGGNLFHSFEKFNLNSHESATLSGPNSVNNIIGRVTGGTASTINGTLRATIPHADVYFINPAGILFGANAKLDVGGSFHASTADTLRLGTDGQFAASHPEQSLLSIAPPSAFGFLTDSPPTLTVQNNTLSLSEGRTLSLVGGDLRLNAATLFAQSGRINLASVASRGEVVPTAFGLNLSAEAQSGQILAHNTQIDVSGEGGGKIFIRGGRVELTHSEINSKTLGHKNGGVIDIQVDNFELQGTRIYTDTFGAGKSSDVVLKVANVLRLAGENQAGFSDEPETGSGIYSNSRGTAVNAGNAGKVLLEAGELTLKDGASISASTYGSGQGGNINIWIKGLVTLSGEDSQGNYSGIFSRTNSQANTAGEGGDIFLTARELIVKDGAAISGSTFGAGQGGTIKIQVEDLVTLSGVDSNGTGSFIGAGTWAHTENAGNGGNLELQARQLYIVDGASIETGTAGPGQGGSSLLKVTESITLSGKKSAQGHPSRILTASEDETAKAGDAGAIVLETDKLSLKDDATISASSSGYGQGGNINIQARYISLTKRGNITASSSGDGNAGNIVLNVAEGLDIQNGFVTTEAASADGGNIYIATPSYLHLISGDITTSVNAENGNGGNISLTLQFIVLDDGKIIARAVGGDGGNIDIATTGIYKFSQSPIDASSQLGIEGEVEIDSPAVNLDDFLVVLPGGYIDASSQLQPPCHVQRATNPNSFVVKRIAGSPPSPDDWKSTRLVLLPPTDEQRPKLQGLYIIKD